MEWLINICRENPAIPLFFTIGVGFYLGQLKFKGFSLGTVTAVLLVGVLVGQMDIQIPGPIKNVFFLLFLFAIGYSVGPQFFRSLRGDGLKQVGFALIECVLVLAVTWILCKLMGYNIGETLGVYAGAQTISAAIGAGIDSLGSKGASAEQVKQWSDVIPVAYAVTYVFGTIGSAWILSWLGPKMLGGLKKVRENTKDLEKELNAGTVTTDPGFVNANRPVTFRAYKATDEFFKMPRTIAEIEQHLADQGKRLFVERMRQGDRIVEIGPDVKVSCGDEIVLSGRREYIIGDEQWIGPEVNDAELLSFPAEQIDVMVKKKCVGKNGITLDELRAKKFMYGITVKSINRGGVNIPVFAKTKIEGGDTLTIVGLEREVNEAAPQLGYADRPTTATDMILVGIGIVIGCLVGLVTFRLGNVPVSLSTSGGALISGLVCGWLRSKHPTFGRIPKPALWVFNNLGLNMFIAVIGITSGPSFVSGLHQVGWMIFVVGAVATSVPLIICIFLGDKVFKFRPAINLGCCAGSRTTTAALGAIQDALGSTVPAMGYTVTYAIGNTLLILMGVALVLIS